MGHDELRQAFFDGYLERHPEEATTLGIAAGAERLRDHRPAALGEERGWYEAMAARLEAIDPTTATVDERLDLDAMRRIVDHHLHLWDRLWCAIDWSPYPYNMVMVQRVHAQSERERAALRQRVDAIPAFLAQHEANVEQGIADGIRPDGALCAFFAEHQLPPSIAALREHLTPEVGEAAERAARAYEGHVAWLKERVLPHTADASRLGRDEVEWRLRRQLGITDEVEALVARGREQLALAREELLRCARLVDGTVRSIDDARALTSRMQGPTLERADEVIPFYRAYVERAQRHVTEHGLFALPDDYRMGIEPLVAGFTAAGHAANWPAPLLDPSKLGHFLVDPAPGTHPLAWAADLAVHEGLPGHHLQSFWWQRHFGRHPSPVRFLLVHDQVAVPRHDWGPMLNIEGYAVYAEELMRRTGFFTPEEELFVLMAHGVRAARLVADLSLHAELLDEHDARRLLVDEVGLREGHAEMEVRRYRQIPLQASTYLLGRLAIEQVVDEQRHDEGFDLASFHERFFGFGPARPAAIGRAMRGLDAPSPAP